MKDKKNSRKKQKTVVYAVVLILVLSASIAIYLWYQSTFFGSSYQKALQSQNPTDKCATPPGYTDESWIDHMSHHPDQYGECLEKLK